VPKKKRLSESEELAALRRDGNELRRTLKVVRRERDALSDELADTQDALDEETARRLALEVQVERLQELVDDLSPKTKTQGHPAPWYRRIWN